MASSTNQGTLSVSNQAGRFAAECHTKANVTKIKLEDVNMVNSLTQCQELDLLETEIDRKSTMSGTISGLQCHNILLDTGAAQTVVNQDLVKEDQYTGKTRYAEAFNGTRGEFPIASVEVELDGISQNLDVLVMKNLKHDALLGRDMPGLWQVGKRLLYDTLINMVRTRSAPSEELQQLTQDHKKGEAEQSENSEDSEDGDEEITQWKKDVPNEHNHSGEDITSSEDSESEIEDIDDERVNELPENVLEENMLLQKDNRISRRRTRVDYCSRVHGHPLDVDIQTLRSEQKADETLKGLWRKVEKGDTGFLVEDGLLWRLAKDRMGDETTQLCLPASFRSMVLSLAHRPGHLGRDRTTQRILDDYFWPGVHVDVKKLCRACYDCQRAARQYQPPAPLRPLPVIEIPFTRIAMDMIGPFPTTAEGKRFALVVMDYATRWPEAFPLRVTDSVTVADELMICLLV